jgi:hypothetical protein
VADRGHGSGEGNHELRRLSVATVQRFLNGKLREIEPGESIRLVHVLRQVLSAALSRAVREELEQIYTHVDEAAKRDALTKLNRLLGGSDD